jgi:hypothetical protein
MTLYLLTITEHLYYYSLALSTSPLHKGDKRGIYPRTLTIKYVPVRRTGDAVPCVIDPLSNYDTRVQTDDPFERGSA